MIDAVEIPNRWPQTPKHFEERYRLTTYYSDLGCSFDNINTVRIEMIERFLGGGLAWRIPGFTSSEVVEQVEQDATHLSGIQPLNVLTIISIRNVLPN